MQKRIYLIILLVVAVIPVKSQSHEINLTGNLRTDSKILFYQANTGSLPQISFQTENKKSPFLAGLFSLVIPGSGEIYAGSYWKAAIFVALEAAVITTALIYDKKGDDQTESFQKYADENWSVVRYAEWLNSYKGADVAINPDASLEPWQRVNWVELNAAETGSHKLPPHGDQQYYELIGKYHQYSSGWNDFTGGANNEIISPNFLYYAGERGEANDLYNVASKAVIGIYINHFLSALDAAWTAIDYNKSLAFKMRMEEVYFTGRMELVPTIKLTFSF